MSEKNSLGVKVKRLRALKKISAEILRIELGYSHRQSIYDIEKGKISKLTFSQYKILGKILGVKPEYFFDDESAMLEDPEGLYLPPIQSNDINKTSRMAHLIEENNRLWKENAMLKTLIIENNIKITF